MSYGVTVSAVDLDWQVERLKMEPQIANKHIYPAMQRSVQLARTQIGSNITFRDHYGTARAELSSDVRGKGMNITGRAGWFGVIQGWYVNILEYGAGAHAIGYVPALQVKIMNHPGIAAGRFVERAERDVKGEVLQNMGMAAVNITNELAIG